MPEKENRAFIIQTYKEIHITIVHFCIGKYCVVLTRIANIFLILINIRIQIHVSKSMLLWCIASC